MSHLWPGLKVLSMTVNTADIFCWQLVRGLQAGLVFDHTDVVECEPKCVARMLFVLCQVVYTSSSNRLRLSLIAAGNADDDSGPYFALKYDGKFCLHCETKL